jgi:diacylglycerol kinase (ATP)
MCDSGGQYKSRADTPRPVRPKARTSDRLKAPISDCRAPSADRVLIVSNPCAGSRLRADALGELAASMRHQGLRVELVEDLASLGPRAQAYSARHELRAVVAAGGDGTVAEVVNRTAPGTPVTVYPMGTANLLAGYFGMRRDPAAMLRVLAGGVLVQLDAGRANGRIFLLMAGCGFDADVVHRLHAVRNGGHISYWTWAGPIWQSIRSYRYPSLRVICDTPDEPPTEVADAACWAFVSNLPVYAAGLNIAATAAANDGMMNVCTFSRGSLWHGLRYVGNIFLKRHHKLADYKCVLASKVRIEADEPVPYQLDGDPGGHLPLEIETLPSRVTLLVPRSAAEGHGLLVTPAGVQGA